jgi:hypothetical protein
MSQKEFYQRPMMYGCETHHKYGKSVFTKLNKSQNGANSDKYVTIGYCGEP